jgi:hypothetical protein
MIFTFVMHIKTCKEHKNECKYDEISSMFFIESMMLSLPKRKKEKHQKHIHLTRGGSWIWGIVNTKYSRT